MTIRPTVITPPTQEPLSVPEAKEHLRAGDNDDNYITDLVICAREYCEEKQACCYYTQTLEMTLDRWPWDSDRFTLPRATPLQSVTSMIYKDQTGAATTWGPANYIVDTDTTPGQIVLPYGQMWPITVLYPVGGVRVRYIAGTDPTSPARPFPARIRHAMRLLIGHWYENREAATIGTLMQSGELVIGVHTLLAFDEEPNCF